MIIEVLAQDQLFMREGNEVIYCYIIHADDSLIVFHSAEPGDSNTYEIPFNETYGFLLEEPPENHGGNKGLGMVLRVSHSSKKRSHLYRENSGIIFRLVNDTALLPRRGKITRISLDSAEIETRINRKKDRYSFAWTDFEQMGYTTNLTELLSFIVFPFPNGKNESAFFYRKMNLNSGWNYQVMSDSPRKIKKKGRWKRIRVGGAIRRKAGGGIQEMKSSMD